MKIENPIERRTYAYFFFKYFPQLMIWHIILLVISMLTLIATTSSPLYALVSLPIFGLSMLITHRILRNKSKNKKIQFSSFNKMIKSVDEDIICYKGRQEKLIKQKEEIEMEFKTIKLA